MTSPWQAYSNSHAFQHPKQTMPWSAACHRPHTPVPCAAAEGYSEGIAKSALWMSINTIGVRTPSMRNAITNCHLVDERACWARPGRQPGAGPSAVCLCQRASTIDNLSSAGLCGSRPCWLLAAGEGLGHGRVLAAAGGLCFRPGRLRAPPKILNVGFGNPQSVFLSCIWREWQLLAVCCGNNVFCKARRKSVSGLSFDGAVNHQPSCHPPTMLASAPRNQPFTSSSASTALIIASKRGSDRLSRRVALRLQMGQRSVCLSACSRHGLLTVAERG